MTSADHITIDGNTAWIVAPIPGWGDRPDGGWLQADRPCDTYPDCKKGRIWPGRDIGEFIDCPDCDGTGRHTFTIEVEDHDQCDVAYRVHVVPGMVLPIVRYGHHDVARIVKRLNPAMDGKDWYIVTPTTEPGEAGRIALPIAAQPGMWAVKLEVHQ